MHDIIIFVGNHCTKCNMLKTMLGESVINCDIRKAEDNMDLCRQWNIKQVPALVIKPKLGREPKVVFDLEEIVDEVERRANNG